jgi:hypothetical protein
MNNAFSFASLSTRTNESTNILGGYKSSVDMEH